MKLELNVEEALKRLIKYMLEGMAVAVAAYLIPKKEQSMEVILTIAVTAAAVFCVLDLFSPAISDSARKGAGFGIGATQVGWTPGL